MKPAHRIVWRMALAWAAVSFIAGLVFAWGAHAWAPIVLGTWGAICSVGFTWLFAWVAGLLED